MTTTTTSAYRLLWSSY